MWYVTHCGSCEWFKSDIDCAFYLIDLYGLARDRIVELTERLERSNHLLNEDLALELRRY